MRKAAAGDEDGAALLGAHRGGHVLGGDQRAADVGLEFGEQPVERDAGGLAHGGVGGVEHQHVDIAQLLARMRQCRADARLAGGVAAVGVGMAAGLGADFLAVLGQPVGPARHQRDVVALIGEGHAHGLADAGAGANDHAVGAC